MLHVAAAAAAACAASMSALETEVVAAEAAADAPLRQALLKFNLAGVVVACNFVAATDAISS